MTCVLRAALVKDIVSEPGQALGIRVDEVIVQDDRALELLRNGEPDEGRELATRSDRECGQNLRAARGGGSNGDRFQS